MKTPRAAKKDIASGYLDGQLLLAMPSMSDKRFRRSVIYLCTHSADGAMGLIVNQRAPDITFTGLLKQLGIVGDDADETVPPDLLRMGVYVGGPVLPSAASCCTATTTSPRTRRWRSTRACA